MVKILFKRQILIIVAVIFSSINLFSQAPFSTTWKTDNISPSSSGPTMITIPVAPFITYNYDVDWTGDMVPDQFGITGSVTHDFGAPGTYTINIWGTFPHIYFFNAADTSKILAINQWGAINWTSMAQAFMGCARLDLLATDIPNLSSVTSLNAMFYGCSSLKGTPLTNWNWPTSTITDLSQTFFGAKLFNSDINSWDTHNVTSMVYTFGDARIFNKPLNNWVTTNVISMQGMFNSALQFNQNISGWNTPNNTNMALQFANARHFNCDISNWNVGNVTSLYGTFSSDTAFNQPIGKWDTHSVTDMYTTFENATQFNQNLNHWNTANVTRMSGTFDGATSFNDSLYSWNTANVIYMDRMFNNASSFNHDITLWNTGNVINMWYMFSFATNFNQNISLWNTSKVTNMFSMFFHAAAFNQNIGSWDLRAILPSSTCSANNSLCEMLSYNGMDCDNYSATLVGWATNTVTPSGIILGATNRSYKSYAITSRNYLISTKSWVINGDNIVSTPTFTFPTSFTICSGASVPVLPSVSTNSAVGSWSPPIISNTTSGNYTYTPSSCHNTLVINVTVNPTPTITTSSISSTTICPGGTVSIVPSGAGSYTLLPTGTVGSSFTVSPTSTSIYTISGTSSLGCISSSSTNLTTTITVGVNPTITASSVSSSVICNGNTATITPTGAINYTLQPGGIVGTSFTVNPTSPTTYTINGTDIYGCANNPTNNLIVNISVSNLTLNISNITNINCYGYNTGSASVTPIGGTPIYTYNWLPTGGAASTGTNLSQGIYTITVSDNNNCIKSNTVQIISLSSEINVGITDTVKPDCGDFRNGSITVSVTGGTPSYSYLWNTGNTTPSISNISNANYTVTVTDANNCTKQLEIELDCFTALYIPELFSPNNDGKNDLFEIKGIYQFPNNKLTIFNRWGNKIFEKEKYSNEWDGKTNANTVTGKDVLPAGTYYVIFEFGDNKTPTYQGFVQLQY